MSQLSNNNKHTISQEYLSSNANFSRLPSTVRKISRSASKSNPNLYGYVPTDDTLSKSLLNLEKKLNPHASNLDKTENLNKKLQISGVSVASRSKLPIFEKIEEKSDPPPQELSKSHMDKQRTDISHISKLDNYTSRSFSSIKNISGKLYSKKQLQLKPPIELPAWNVSSKRVVNIAKSKNFEMIQKDSNNINANVINDSIDIEPIVNTVLSNEHKREIQATPFQLEICSRILPSYGEELKHENDHFITQAFAISDEKLDPSIVEKCINKLIYEYNILSMNATRNTRIIDADIQFYLDKTPLDKIEMGKYFKHQFIQFNSLTSPIDQIYHISARWASEQELTKSSFGGLLLEVNPGAIEQFLILGGSRAILDEFSLTWISKKILELLGNNGWKGYSSEESLAFANMSYQNYRTRSDISFWRDQCIEVSQENVSVEERNQFEKKLKGLQKDILNLKTSLASASKRKNELENELNLLRKQRMAIDAHVNEKPVYITDPTTGNTIEMTKSAKMALIKSVLGEEAIGENISPFLNKHDVSLEVQRKLNASQISLEEFSTLTGPSIEPLNLHPKDKRQLLALVDYVTNRIKESVQEQGKVKFALERHIFKLSRALEDAVTDLNLTIRKIDGNEDMTFRLHNILHPPFVERLLVPLNLKSSEDIQNYDCIQKWGFFDFVVRDETLDNLHKFREEWTNNIRNKRKTMKLLEQDDSDNESLFDLSDDEDHLKDEKLKEKSVDAVCLAAFGVLMRHISGNNSFLIGVNTSFRTKGSIVGPYSDTLPVKIDLSKKDMSFSALFSSLYRIFKNIKRHGSTCPLAYLAKEFKVDLEFPVQFHFISRHEYKGLVKLGLTDNDILRPHEISSTQMYNNIHAERLWSENPENNYSIKFIMIEKDASIVCGVRYLRNKFEEDRVLKWIAKFQSTLEGIDCSRRKLSVTSMITRFYNPVWKSNSSITTSSAPSLRASSMYLFSSSELDLQ